MLLFKVLAECRRKFPEYTFLGDAAISKSASVSNRYNANSLRGIIVDIYMLSQTDYLVGTFSSQVSFTCVVSDSWEDSITFAGCICSAFFPPHNGDEEVPK